MWKRIAFATLACLFSSCATNSNLRPARTLEKGKAEAAGGMAVPSASVIAMVAYGITDNVDLEFKHESSVTSTTARYQLTKSENVGLDSVVFAQVGYGGLWQSGTWMGSAGFSLGRRVGDFEPYVGYRYQTGTVGITYLPMRRESFSIDATAHLLKLGSRYYLNESPLFFAAEIGATTLKFENPGIKLEGAFSVGVRL